MSSLRHGSYSEFQIPYFHNYFHLCFFYHRTNLNQDGETPTPFRMFLQITLITKNIWNLWNHIVNKSRSCVNIYMCSLKIPKVSKLYIWHSSLDVWCLTKKRTIQSRCVLSIDKERKEGFTAFSQKDSQLRPNTFKFAFWFLHISTFWFSTNFNEIYALFCLFQKLQTIRN